MKLVIGLVLAAGMFTFVSCGKKGGSTGEVPTSIVVEGVSVDLPKLIQALETATPELQTSARNVQMAFRYGQYEKALMEVDKLVNDTTLTEEQKKIAGEVLEQVKQVMAKAPPAAAPAQ